MDRAVGVEARSAQVRFLKPPDVGSFFVAFYFRENLCTCMEDRRGLFLQCGIVGTKLVRLLCPSGWSTLPPKYLPDPTLPVRFPPVKAFFFVALKNSDTSVTRIVEPIRM